MTTEQRERVKPLVDAKKYTIGIVCALSHEADAVQAALDHRFTDPKEYPATIEGDRNTYTYGTLSGYYVVLAYMGKAGNNESTDVAGDMRRSFPGIKLCVLVGITAIVPQIKNHGRKYDALMGDVVISRVVKQYDYAKDYPRGFVPKDIGPQATPEQSRFISWLESRENKEIFRSKLLMHLLKLEKNKYMEDFLYPGCNFDHLYDSECVHEHGPGSREPNCEKCRNKELCEKAAKTSCEDLKCAEEMLIKKRKRINELMAIEAVRGDCENTIALNSLEPSVREKVMPMIFTGDIAAGNRVMKNGAMRDDIANTHDVIAIEMEGVGIRQQFAPSVVIKAGCDYGDSHKNDVWQLYACMTAAACAKAFLEVLQMGIKKNVEYGEGFADGSGTSYATPNAARSRYYTISNNIHGNVSGSTIGSSFESDRDMIINMGSSSPRRGRKRKSSTRSSHEDFSEPSDA